MSATTPKNAMRIRGVGNRATEMKLEVVVVPVSDVDRAKKFYESAGFRMDIDLVLGDDRVVQVTPPGSPASIHIGKGISTAAPGSATLMMAVNNVNETREELKRRGVAVGEIFHPGNGSFYRPATRVKGPEPQRQTYSSFTSFSDPDGNQWLLQEITTRLPGRGINLDLASLTELLKETAERHGRFEKTHGKHDWWDWYGAYMNARQNGSTPDDASTAADLHMEKVLSVVPAER